MGRHRKMDLAGPTHQIRRLPRAFDEMPRHAANAQRGSEGVSSATTGTANASPTMSVQIKRMLVDIREGVVVRGKGLARVEMCVSTVGGTVSSLTCRATERERDSSDQQPRVRYIPVMPKNAKLLFSPRTIAVILNALACMAVAHKACSGHAEPCQGPDAIFP